MVTRAGILSVRAQNLEVLRAQVADAAAQGPAIGVAVAALGTNLRRVDLPYAAVSVTLADGGTGLLIATLPGPLGPSRGWAWDWL